jgi:hypothetical protein
MPGGADSLEAHPNDKLQMTDKGLPTDRAFWPKSNYS